MISEGKKLEITIDNIFKLIIIKVNKLIIYDNLKLNNNVKKSFYILYVYVYISFTFIIIILKIY